MWELTSIDALCTVSNQIDWDPSYLLFSLLLLKFKEENSVSQARRTVTAVSVMYRTTLTGIKVLLLFFFLLNNVTLRLSLLASNNADCQAKRNTFLSQFPREDHVNKATCPAKKNSETSQSSKDASCHLRKDRCYSFVSTEVASNSSAANFSTVCVSELGITESARKTGFASLLLMTLDHISFCLLAGGKPVVYWRGGLSLIRSKSKNPLFNSWSLFFEPFSINTEKKATKKICLGRVLHVPDFQSITPRANISHLRSPKSSFKTKPVVDLKFRQPRISNLPHIDFGGVISTYTKLWVNTLLNKFVKVKQPIKKKVETFYHKYLHGYQILGVHTRGTDHIHETELGRLPKLELWGREAEIIFTSMPSPKRIFVASDNMEAVEKFVEHFGRDAVSIENVWL